MKKIKSNVPNPLNSAKNSLNSLSSRLEKRRAEFKRNMSKDIVKE